jgi:hypothetical protein
MAEMTEKNHEDRTYLKNFAKNGEPPHYCIRFQPAAELVLQDKVLDENHISATSMQYGQYYEGSKQEDVRIRWVVMGKRIELDVYGWSIVELFLKTTECGFNDFPDFCVQVGCPSSWSKLMYLSCLLSLIEIEDSPMHYRGDTNRFVLRNRLNIAGKLYYTVGQVEKLFDVSIPELNIACKASNELVEGLSENDAVLRMFIDADPLENKTTDGGKPHCCARFFCGELFLKDRVMNENHISATSVLYRTNYEGSKQANLYVKHVTMGKRIRVNGNEDWSIVELFLKCTSFGTCCPPDLCVHVGFPTPWTKKMYLSCLKVLIDSEYSGLYYNKDTDKFVLHNTLNIGGKLYYTVGQVEKLFKRTIPELNLFCRESLEIVEKQSEETDTVSSVYRGNQGCLEADLGGSGNR